jgi:hypothetical protein
MPHFRFGGWTHAEAVWSHKIGALKEPYYMLRYARSPDLNICTHARLMQPYFFGHSKILLSVLSVPGCFQTA